MGDLSPNPKSQIPNPTLPLVAIVGPTASGKTALAIELAQMFDGEIICADSRTVYKNLDISTAKPTPQERATVPHHLLDVVEVDEVFNVADFKELASKSISDIISRHKLPILVGGSGLYVDSVLYDYKFGNKDAKRDVTNPRHLDMQAPRVKSRLREQTLIVGIGATRNELRRRITSRVKDMMGSGLIDEVVRLTKTYGWHWKAFDAPAFKALKPYLAGQVDLEDAKRLFITYDMQLAKRQMTWFKRNKDVHWVKNSSEAVELLTTFLNKYK